jgi:tetrahydromethanopterin S-methyltransferase subunit B
LYFAAETSGFSPFTIAGETTASGTPVQPVTGNKIPSEVDDTQNDAGNKTSNIDKIPERTQSSTTSGKEGSKIPGFEMASGIVCLLSVFLYKRR